ncbi:TolC family protein [Pseudoalteromonas piscicida]|uniref:TolC family protein n=1 Tax=Pseudoalteromonas piscicida TaxID=43662 RepID=UPI001EF9F4A3|nr:TolC family protein [Pseudoalteromonas piscicida]
MKLKIICLCTAFSLCSEAHADLLLDLYKKGAEKNLAVNAEQSAYLAGIEGEKQSFAQFLPNLKLTANVRYTDQESWSSSDNLLRYQVEQKSTTDSRQVELSVDQLLFDLSTYHNFEASKLNTIQAKVRFQKAVSNYTNDYLVAYFEVVKAREKLLFIQETLGAYADQNNIINSRYAFGLVKISEVKESESQQLKVKAQEALAQNDLSIAFEKLSLLTQTEVSAIQVLTAEVPVLHQSQQKLATLQNKYEKNLDYKLAVLDQSVAARKLKAQQSKHLPTVTGRLSYTDNDDDNTYNYKAADSLERRGWNAGVYLEMPLYSGGATSSASEAAKLSVEQRRYLKQLKGNEVKQQIIASFSTLNAMHSSIMANGEAVKAAELALKSAEDEYFTGVGPFSRVLDNRAKLLSENLSLIQDKYDYMARFVALKELVGELTIEEVSYFSNLFGGEIAHKSNIK